MHLVVKYCKSVQCAFKFPISFTQQKKNGWKMKHWQWNRWKRGGKTIIRIIFLYRKYQTYESQIRTSMLLCYSAQQTHAHSRRENCIKLWNYNAFGFSIFYSVLHWKLWTFSSIPQNAIEFFDVFPARQQI